MLAIGLSVGFVAETIRELRAQDQLSGLDHVRSANPDHAKRNTQNQPETRNPTKPETRKLRATAPHLRSLGSGSHSPQQSSVREPRQVS